MFSLFGAGSENGNIILLNMTVENAATACDPTDGFLLMEWEYSEMPPDGVVLISGFYDLDLGGGFQNLFTPHTDTPSSGNIQRFIGNIASAPGFISLDTVIFKLQLQLVSTGLDIPGSPFTVTGPYPCVS